MTWRHGAWTGMAMIAAVFAFGVAVAGDRGPLAIDRWGMSLVSHVSAAGAWKAASKLSSPYVLGAVMVFSAAFVLKRSRLVAFVCLALPLSTVGLVEVAKHVFGRLYTGVPSYPSGNVAAITSVVAVALMVAEPKRRHLVLALGVVSILVTGIAVVALGWHYPTDAVAGCLFATGVALTTRGALETWGNPQDQASTRPEHAD